MTHPSAMRAAEAAADLYSRTLISGEVDEMPSDSQVAEAISDALALPELLAVLEAAKEAELALTYPGVRTALRALRPALAAHRKAEEANRALDA